VEAGECPFSDLTRLLPMRLQRIYTVLRMPYRERRMHLFVRTLGITPATRVLDLGGTPLLWELSPIRPCVTLLNIRQFDTALPSIVADAVRLPLKDGSFDVVFSNSLIEHLPPASWQAFANECRRVGMHLWVQAPNQRFPIEPHLMTPFIHWLPRPWQHRLARWSVRALVSDDSDRIVRVADHIHLPTADQMRSLFPDARIVVERWLGMPKSLIVVL
jgi:SAM-dependent methyltransferase